MRLRRRHRVSLNIYRDELPAAAQELDEDELIDCWTLVGNELELVGFRDYYRNPYYSKKIGRNGQKTYRRQGHSWEVVRESRFR